MAKIQRGPGIPAAPSQAEVQALVGLMQTGQFKEVAIKSKKLLKKFPQALVLYNLMSAAQLSQENFKGAIATLEKALVLKPDFVDGEYNLALAHMNLGQLDEAVLHFKNVIRQKPEFVEAYNNLGATYLEQDRQLLAVENYEKAVELKPDFVPAVRNLGALLRDLGRLEESETWLTKLIFLQPRYAAGHYSLGMTQKELGKMEKAISSFETARKLDPEMREVNYEFAIIHKSSGEYDEAVLAFDKVNTIDARARAAETLFEAGKKDELLERVAKLNDEEPENLRASALSTYVSQQYGIENTHPFCRDPLSLVWIYNTLPELEDSSDFLDLLIAAADDLAVVKDRNTTQGGLQTHGNLFDPILESAVFDGLETLVRSKLEDYLESFSDSQDDIIQKFPTEYSLSGWRVKLMKSGHQRPHIHAGGWVSGVFYLKIPQKMKGNEGAIQFSLHGYDYPIVKKDVPGREHVPSVGDLVLFPSSLFHQTVPFDSDEERQCIAFDVVPIRS